MQRVAKTNGKSLPPGELVLKKAEDGLPSKKANRPLNVEAGDETSLDVRR